MARYSRVVEGNWTYSFDLDNFFGGLVATNKATGETFTARNMQAAKKIISARNETRRSPSVRYTIASGPERAQQTRRHTN